MADSDVVEFEMPVQFEGHLAGDPQFVGMTRKVTITRAAILKAIDMQMTAPTQALYDEFFFDVWMRVRDEAWRKKPEGGAIRLDVDDINSDAQNDVPEVRALFAGFTIEPVDLSYRISGKVTAARELIISGGAVP